MASAETENKSVFTFLWRIEKFSYWDREYHGMKIVSPQLSSLWFGPNSAYLHLFPKGAEEGDQHLRVHFHTNNSEQRNYTVEFELSFLDRNGLALTTGIISSNKIKNATLDLPCCPTQEEVFQSKRSSFLPHDTLTVRCRLWRSDLPQSTYRHVYFRSRINVREASILLDHGLLKTLQLNQEKVCVLRFEELASDDILYCTYSLTGSSLSKAVVNFKIDKTKHKEPFLMTCKLSLLNTEGKTIKCIEARHKFNSSNECQIWHFPHFLTRKELLDNRDIDRIYTKITASVNNISEILTVTMLSESGTEFVFPKDDVPTLQDACIQATQKMSDHPDNSQQRSYSLAILGGDFLSIYKDQTLHDFELRSGDVSFPVHKIVLSARSPVFRAMFCGDMREVKSTSLNVPDVDAHTLNRMLTFLYAGTVDDLQWEGAVKLYYAADKYQVLSLKEECSSILRSSVTVSNVCDILALADRHQDHELTSFVHDFFHDHFDEILISDEWGTFLESDAFLAGTTMRQVYKRKLEVPK